MRILKSLFRSKAIMEYQKIFRHLERIQWPTRTITSHHDLHRPQINFSNQCHNRISSPRNREMPRIMWNRARDAGGKGAAENGEDIPGDADTVWIDSGADGDPEANFLRANIELSYSDRNYDCPDPVDRVIH
ncbi:hypothetical protein GCK72_022724 [Caenorhabditis remanei]|uniref:Uncharacterized protein n=1 Tax=Caenorhabditis remanei TaxID=31234 RepID=A0A6A5FV50_CAERE|nr:hypothetical protein GCK72_022724 [Caenorhabditis remanei]KAF1746271.1 hypothetical protein GCK72_022724 [Caenorhabditis remanei]